MGMSNLPGGSYASRQRGPLDRFRVDAWNAGDGALFVSLRPPRLDVWSEQEGPEVETYLLRAPDFDAVPVPRALAYGAVRRGGQEGFSLDGVQEVAFDTLAQVRELARRAYIASAIGDGGPEGDAPPREGPPPPDSGPSLVSADKWTDGVNRWSEDLARAVDQLSLETSGQAQPVDRIVLRQALTNALRDEVLEEAAVLLLASAEQTLDVMLAEYASVPVARSLIYLASCLIGVDDLRNTAQRLPLGGQAMHLVHMMFDHPWAPGFGYGGQGREGSDAMRLLCDGLLPDFHTRRTLNLPPRCQTWIDALEYLSADRQYFRLGRNGAWLPLAIAIACISTAPRMPVEPWFEPGRHGKGDHRSAWLSRIADFIASMIPAGGLPLDVESWVRDRCWSHQRGPAVRGVR